MKHLLRCSTAAITISFAVLLLLSLPAPASERTDVVILENGDRITGEVKGLERGKLSLKTDSLGTVQIQWIGISALTSSQYLEVELDSGAKYYGTLRGGRGAGLEVVGPDGSPGLALDSIVRIVPIEGSFWERLEGSMDLGLAFASANQSTQLTLQSDVRFRTRDFERSLGYSSTFVDQKDAERTKRQDLDLSWKRFFGERRFSDLVVQFQENEALGLELRSLVALYFGRNTVQRSDLRLGLFAGLAGNSEDFLDGPAETSAELVGGLALNFFRFDEPEVDLDIDFAVFPSLTESGRVRAELNARLRREILKDFFWAISLYESYDSSPPSRDLPTNDWGFNTSLGWSF